jgi:acyl carrier protein
MTIIESLRDFIVDELRWDGPKAGLTEDYPLLENRVIDSMGLFRIVDFLESRYGIEVDDDELVPANFATLHDIAQLAERSR